MKQSIVLLGLIIMIASCKKNTNYHFRIGIDNSTNSELRVKVFPKSQFINGDMYKISSSDDFSEVEFTINSDESEILFTTTKLDYEPQKLLAEIFDSLTITINLDTVLIIKFKPDYVENYKVNMFSENSIWKYKTLKGSEKTNFSSHPFEIYDYKFEIKEDDLGK